MDPKQQSKVLLSFYQSVDGQLQKQIDPSWEEKQKTLHSNRIKEIEKTAELRPPKTTKSTAAERMNERRIKNLPKFQQQLADLMPDMPIEKYILQKELEKLDVPAPGEKGGQFGTQAALAAAGQLPGEFGAGIDTTTDQRAVKIQELLNKPTIDPLELEDIISEEQLKTLGEQRQKKIDSLNKTIRKIEEIAPSDGTPAVDFSGKKPSTKKKSSTKGLNIPQVDIETLNIKPEKRTQLKKVLNNFDKLSAQEKKRVIKIIEIAKSR